MSKKRFIVNSVILASTSCFFRIISIFFNGYLSQKVGAEILGTYSLIMTVYAFGITLGSFGIDFSAIKLISENLSLNNKEAVNKLSHKCIEISCLFGIATSFIFLICSKPIINIFLHNKINTNVIFLMCLAIPFISMSSAIYGYFVAVRRVYKATIAQFFEQIIKLIITFLLLNLYTKNGLNKVYFSLILGDLISEIVAFILNYILFLKDVRIYKTSYLAKTAPLFYIKQIIFIAFPIAITSLLRSGLSSIKQFIIPLSFSNGKFDYAQAISIYGQINGMAFPIILFPSIIFRSISSLLVPELSAYSVQKNMSKTKKAIKTILLVSTAVAFFISSILYLFSYKLSILIYKTEIIGIYIKILAPVTIFILLDNVIDNILRGINRQNDVMYINILDIVVTTLLIYFIVPNFGIKGYIFCIYFSEIFNIALSFYTLEKSGQ